VAILEADGKKKCRTASVDVAVFTLMKWSFMRCTKYPHD